MPERLFGEKNDWIIKVFLWILIWKLGIVYLAKLFPIIKETARTLLKSYMKRPTNNLTTNIYAVKTEIKLYSWWFHFVKKKKEKGLC